MVLPASLWGLSALLEVHASRLDIAILEADLDDED